MEQKFTWILLGRKECGNGEQHDYVIFETPYFFNNISECFVDYSDYIDTAPAQDSLQNHVSLGVRYIAEKFFVSHERPSVNSSPYMYHDELPGLEIFPGDDELTKTVKELEFLEWKNTHYQWRIYAHIDCDQSSESWEHMMEIEKSTSTFATIYECLQNYNVHAQGLFAAFDHDELHLYVEAVEV